MSFFYCNFAAYSIIAQRRIYIFCSPRRGGVQKCGGIQDIINSVLTRFVLTHLNLVNSSIQNNATLRCLWYVFMCARIYACTLINIYGVGYGVAVCNERQYQSLCKWNGKIAVPLLFFILRSFNLRSSAFS